MANKKTQYKTITHIPGQIRIVLPNGTRKAFNNSSEAQQFFNDNYGEGYSMEITSTTDNNGEVTINGGELPEVTVVGQAPKNKLESDTDRPVDFNVEHQPILRGFLNANSDRTRNIANPFTFVNSSGQRSTIHSYDFIPAKVEAISVGIPVGFTGAYQTINYFEDRSHLNAINSFINEPDDVILGMPEQDRKMFTQEGVDSLYHKYRTDPYWKDQDENTLNRRVYYKLSTLYDKYVPKEDE